MPKVLQRNAVIVFGLACLFYWLFMFAKHDPALLDVIPFGEDPYDAIGSFGVIVGILVALLSLFRAFRPYREAPSGKRQVYLIRSQEAVVLVVFITLGSDALSMGRHPSMWIGSKSQNMLIALLGGMALVTAAVQLAIRTSQSATEPTAKDWKAATVATVFAILVLVAYPEQLIHGTATHLLTVVAGAIVLFAPMRPLLNALVPYASDERRTEEIPARNRSLTAWQRWVMVALVGAIIGACAFLGEIGEGSGARPVNRLALLASVFIGLGLTGLLIAYTFLREPLGLGSQ
ncbi:hypothetical protein ACPOL_1253 [Acidisarcina polymorpha]|uniref:Transmembrane protein n=1 Tax=Acidisarcina polymorpha TaxID=2211140 RepID=A0A2Z5FUR2_9BACT|nr:hypothetical protein [Acidisarcina polymorpha]AXC10601.1 hypothetical protein ACPOL_1253 [Acidisarcina polymorpha]